MCVQPAEQKLMLLDIQNHVVISCHGVLAHWLVALSVETLLLHSAGRTSVQSLELA
jgi:hypothetical protein